MKVGDIVTIRPAVAPPQLYGVGIVVKVEDMRCFVQWSRLPDKPLRGCAPWALEAINESR